MGIEVLLKIVGPLAARALAAKPVQEAKNWLSRRQAGKKALQGHDFAHHASLRTLLSERFGRLVKSETLPPELRFPEFETWLRRDRNLDDFVTVLIARAANRLSLGTEASDRLSDEYGRVTGESPKLAPGRVDLVISWVLGDLQATDAGQSALQGALAFMSASQALPRSLDQEQSFPSKADLARIHATANDLLGVGRQRWKMPSFVAPLAITVTTEGNASAPVHTDVGELAVSVKAGEDLVIFGEGGMGKTTLMLDLCSACLVDGQSRVPFYVDASVWARSEAPLLDFLMVSTSARQNGVTSKDLAKLAECGLMTVMINGWNEIPAAQKSICAEFLRDLAVTANRLNTVIVSRSVADVPALRVFKKTRVGGLSWAGQSRVIRAELTNGADAPLIELLTRDNQLRHAARSPLILRGLIENARTSKAKSECVYDLLGSVVRAFEVGEQRASALRESPVLGYHQRYLEELASQLTNGQSTTISRDDAIRAVTKIARSLSDLIGPPPSSVDILAVLGQHHLLHIEEGSVRFAHQRFQEYFAANRVLAECSDLGADDALSAILNAPAWEDALLLAAGKLRGAEYLESRVRLIEAAERLDTGLACSLVGPSGFRSADSRASYDRIVQRVRKLLASPLDEVHEFGIRCAISSSLPDFSASLWELIEANDGPVSVLTSRFSGTGISISQLGADAEVQMADFSARRRSELLHEFSDNPDNYDFLVKVARSDLEPSVRTDAIAALFWNFPASEAPIDAWLNAPEEVQLSSKLIDSLRYAMEDGLVNPEVNGRLLDLVNASSSEETKSYLVLSFLSIFGPRAIDAIFKLLENDSTVEVDPKALTLAGETDCGRLMSLAKELLLTRRAPPNWAVEHVSKATSEHRSDVFERAWTILQSEQFDYLSPVALGPLSSLSQTQRSITFYLGCIAGSTGTSTKIEREREQVVRQFLVNAPGEFLVKEAVRCSGTCTYQQAGELLHLVLSRISDEYPSLQRSAGWVPSIVEAKELISCFRGAMEPVGSYSDRVHVLLACIATLASPTEFTEFLVEAYQRQLDRWSNFQSAIDKWASVPLEPAKRPQNPSYGNYLNSALRRVGPIALPALNALMVHPSAIKMLPEAICAAALSPWAFDHMGRFDGVSEDVKEGNRRMQLGRVLLQPTPEFQTETDESARLIGLMLTNRLPLLAAEKASSAQWRPQFAKHQVDGLIGTLARIPSPAIIAPIFEALSSGLVRLSGAMEAWRGLVRQGFSISDRSVLGELEALFERTSKEAWLDDWHKQLMAEFSELLFCVEPPTLLTKSLSHYLEQWTHYAYPMDIARRLGKRKLGAAWPEFLAWGKRIAATDKPPPEEFVSALTSALSLEYLPTYLSLISDKSLFAWFVGTWELERHVASPLAKLIGDAPESTGLFVQACREASSPVADALAGAVLTRIKTGGPVLVELTLESINSGRAFARDGSGYRRVLEMFREDVPTEFSGQYEVHPRSCNKLRAGLYLRAKESGYIADGCKRLLAAVEGSRLHLGRPNDETRHPALDEKSTWTDVLAG